MEIHRELYIRGPNAQLLEFIEDVTQGLGGGWTREKGSEDDLNRDGGEWFCFKYGGPRTPHAMLCMTFGEDGALYVPNVVPVKSGHLPTGAYNAVVADFYRRFVEKMDPGRGLSCQLTDSQAGLEQWLSPRSARLLQGFSHGANKSTGSSHPSDKEAWNAFIVSAHAEGSELDESMLGRWLLEEGGWDEERAEELSMEYESGRSLLSDYQTLLDAKAA
jgi:hypothetical protein